MNDNQTNAEQLEELIDKIFLLNHNIVEFMISEAKTEEFSEKYKNLEKVIFMKLSLYYKKLRECILKRLNYNKDLLRMRLNGSYDEEIIEESIIQECESIKKDLIENLWNRMQEPFEEMNLVKLMIPTNNEFGYIVKESIYQGTCEESIRNTEFQLVKKSLFEQINIINCEEYFQKYNENFISPLVSPVLIEAFSDMIKSSNAEKDCRKILKNIKNNENQFENLSEIKNFEENIQYLMIEERYKKLFEKYIGILNPYTSYGAKFISLYKNGELDRYTGLSNEEIYTKVKNINEEYYIKNNKKIRELFKEYVSTVENRDSSRNVVNVWDFIKEKYDEDVEISFKEGR